MTALSAFGLFAVRAMLVCYAFEDWPQRRAVKHISHFCA